MASSSDIGTPSAYDGSTNTSLCGEQPVALLRVDPREHAHAVAERRRQLPHAFDIAIAGQHQPRAGAQRLGQRRESIDEVIGALAFPRRPRCRN